MTNPALFKSISGVFYRHLDPKISHYQQLTGYFLTMVFGQRKGKTYLTHSSYLSLLLHGQGLKGPNGCQLEVGAWRAPRLLVPPYVSRVFFILLQKNYDNVLKVFARFEEKLSFFHKSSRFRPKQRSSKGNFLENHYLRDTSAISVHTTDRVFQGEILIIRKSANWVNVCRKCPYSFLTFSCR